MLTDKWNEILRNADGSINEEQLAKELSDFDTMLSEVPKVYCHVTGDLLSKPLYESSVVISAANANAENRVQVRLKDGLADMVRDEIITQEVADIIIANSSQYI